MGDKRVESRHNTAKPVQAKRPQLWELRERSLGEIGLILTACPVPPAVRDMLMIRQITKGTPIHWPY